MNDLGIKQLGAGDLIDRAVRFYRKFFGTFILIAAPAIVAGTLISVGWTLLARQIFAVGSSVEAVESAFYLVFQWFGSIIIWSVETIATLVVMGGASRNFVRHLLFDEPITFAETYRNTWQRLGGLIVASALITFILGTIGVVIFYFGAIVGFLLVAGAAFLFGSIPVLAFLVGVAIGLVVFFATLWLFFLVASRVAYVPQVMLVEGLGVFSAIARSASLASGNVRRLAALFLFTTVATYSALMLLYVPLLWYASSQGIEMMVFDADVVPAWYEIFSNLIWQMSLILLSPVWMIGLCLLYVDERVRGEGYDIELMAARRLGDIPDVPSTYVNPLTPALSGVSHTAPANAREILTLGLK